VHGHPTAAELHTRTWVVEQQAPHCLFALLHSVAFVQVPMIFGVQPVHATVVVQLPQVPPTGQGAAVEGTAVEGTAVEGTAVEGTAVDGAADEGAADEGAADEGAADEGAADEGAADEGAALVDGGIDGQTTGATVFSAGAAELEDGAAVDGAALDGGAGELLIGIDMLHEPFRALLSLSMRSWSCFTKSGQWSLLAHG